MNNENEITAYRNLSNAVNVCTFSKENFVKEFCKDHRYLQGQVFDLAMAIINECAKDEYQYDERNEYCHAFAKRIVNTNKDLF